ncbi:MAG: hypothetical protein F7C07_05580 [Desulfurococcales archaeon]|nr:hypothetical protein [Desulfurococcales archaeon]
MESGILSKKELKVINIGLRHFYEALREQGIMVANVNWSPPPKLEKDIEEILDKLL